MVVATTASEAAMVGTRTQVWGERARCVRAGLWLLRRSVRGVVATTTAEGRGMFGSRGQTRGGIGGCAAVRGGHCGGCLGVDWNRRD